jgi:hypothetical protein
MFVYGDSLQNYLVAIAVIDPPIVEKWAKENCKIFQSILMNFI